MVTDLPAIELSTDVGRDHGATMAPLRRLTSDPDVPLASALIDWRGFHTELQRAAIRATQTGAPLSLLMLEQMASDRVNQPHGSEVVVTAMGALAGAVRAAVGERGLLARYSDGRLAAILTDTDLDKAVASAERIALEVSSPRCDGAGRVDLETTAAIGIAQFRDDESLGHLIQRTAEALKQARTHRGLAVLLTWPQGSGRVACCGTFHLPDTDPCRRPRVPLYAAGEEPVAPRGETRAGLGAYAVSDGR